MANKRTPEERRMILAANIEKYSEDTLYWPHTQSELADRLGISGRQLQRYKSGASEPLATTLFNLAKILKVDLLVLYLSEAEWLDYIREV